MPQQRISRPEAIRSGGFQGGVQVTPAAPPVDGTLQQLSAALGRFQQAAGQEQERSFQREVADLDELAASAASEAQSRGLDSDSFLQAVEGDSRFNALRRNPGRFMARMDVFSGHRAAQQDYEAMIEAGVDLMDVGAVDAWRSENVQSSDSPFFSRAYRERQAQYDSQVEQQRLNETREDVAEAATATLGAHLAEEASQGGWGAAMDALATSQDYDPAEVSRSALQHAEALAMDGQVGEVREILEHSRAGIGLSFLDDQNHSTRASAILEMAVRAERGIEDQARTEILGNIQLGIVEGRYVSEAELRNSAEFEALEDGQKASVLQSYRGSVSEAGRQHAERVENGLRDNAVGRAIELGALSSGAVWTNSSGEAVSLSPAEAAEVVEQNILAAMGQTPAAFARLSQLSADQQIAFPALTARMSRALAIPQERLVSGDLTVGQQAAIETFMEMDPAVLPLYMANQSDLAVATVARELNRMGAYEPAEALHLAQQTRGVEADAGRLRHWREKVIDGLDDATFSFPWEDRSQNLDGNSAITRAWAESLAEQASRIEQVAGRRAAQDFANRIAEGTMVVNRQPLGPVGQIQGREGTEFMASVLIELAGGDEGLSDRLRVEGSPDGVLLENESYNALMRAADRIGFDVINTDTGIEVFDEDGPVRLGADELNAMYVEWRRERQELFAQQQQQQFEEGLSTPTLGERAMSSLASTSAWSELNRSPYSNVGIHSMNGGDREVPQASTGDAPADVPTAITQAAESVGVSAEYLRRTAERESALDPAARASTSSATGLFQFVDQTWLSMLHRRGAEHGYGDLASSITRSSSGRYTVADEAVREDVLGLRNDPRAASLMAAELARENAGTIARRIGREPSDGELYAAHFLGASKAADLIEEAERTPDRIAADMFPAEARSNRPVFYRAGRPLTLRQLLENLSGI